jgi:hypothetical protein
LLFQPEVAGLLEEKAGLGQRLQGEAVVEAARLPCGLFKRLCLEQLKL